jgi:hypothetical protein
MSLDIPSTLTPHSRTASPTDENRRSVDCREFNTSIQDSNVEIQSSNVELNSEITQTIAPTQIPEQGESDNVEDLSVEITLDLNNSIQELHIDTPMNDKSPEIPTVEPVEIPEDAQRHILLSQIATSKSLLREMIPRLEKTSTQVLKAQSESSILRTYCKNMISSLGNGRDALLKSNGIDVSAYLK